jgi:hypothetical protein
MVKRELEGDRQRCQRIHTDTGLLTIFQAADLIYPYATQR